jgi:hypothetical protein
MNAAISAHSSASDAHAALFADKLDKDGDGSNLTEVFVQAATRANILTGENHATLFGKIKKVIADLGTAAFKNSGSANGVAELGSDGKVLSSQLPSYVDDVLEYASLSSFPATGESGKIYVAQDTNKTYRWSGSSYVEISASLTLGETSSTAYRGDRGKTAYDHSQATGNPHSTTASQVGAVATDGDGSNVTATFSQAASRTNLTTGEKLSVLFGKIMKWFADLGTAAFKNVPSSGNAASTEVVLGNDSRLTDARTPASHSQAASTISA